MADIIRHLGRAVLIEEMSASPLRVTPDRSPLQTDAMRSLVDSGLVTIERLDAAGYARFLEIVGAPSPGDVGDGEAAAIALAASCNAHVVVDEPKTMRIAASLLGREPLHSLDLITASVVIGGLGEKPVGQLILAAARVAHIRVPPRFRSWTADLLGIDARLIESATSSWVAVVDKQRA